MERQTQKLIDDLNLNLRADQLVRSLTMGMQQLVKIIKAISAEAKIVVMDEPTSSLSQGEVEILFGIIQLLQKKNIGIIYISHRLEELFAITDRIVVLRDGKMVGDIKTKEAEKDNLINLMVGRELDSFYTKNKHHIGEIALSVKNLSHEKYFSNASFTARYGEIVGFAGLVGSGRTELMKTVFGAYAKKNGEIQLDGKSLEIKNPKDAIRNGIAYVSEDRRGEGLILKNDVKFNMGLVCLKDFVKGIRVKNKEWNSMVEEYRKKFSIKITSSKQLTGNLSGGNQQKVVLAKFIDMPVDIYIFDEPTRGIDVGAKSEIYSLIERISGEGASVIIISSEIPEVQSISDRIAIMKEGEVVKILQLDEFRNAETILKYSIGG